MSRYANVGMLVHPFINDFLQSFVDGQTFVMTAALNEASRVTLDAAFADQATHPFR